MSMIDLEGERSSQAWASKQSDVARREFESWVSRAMPRAVGKYESKKRATVTCNGVVVTSTVPSRIRQYYVAGTLCRQCPNKCHKNYKGTDQ